MVHCLRYNFGHPAVVERYITKENWIWTGAIDGAQSYSIQLTIAKKWTTEICGTHLFLRGLYTYEVLVFGSSSH